MKNIFEQTKAEFVTDFIELTNILDVDFKFYLDVEFTDGEERILMNQKCVFINCKFDGLQFSKTINESLFVFCEFKNCNFKRTMFVNSVFNGCKFSNCFMQHFKFVNSKALYTSFNNCDLELVSNDSLNYYFKSIKNDNICMFENVKFNGCTSLFLMSNDELCCVHEHNLNDDYDSFLNDFFNK